MTLTRTLRVTWSAFALTVAVTSTGLMVPRAIGAELLPAPLVQIPGVGLSGCTADGVAEQSGTNFPGTEIEPWAEVNPLFPSNIIAGWQQDRWSNGGARTLAAGVSQNGGAGWTAAAIPEITQCSSPAGTYQRASDPWLSFAPTGDAYFMSLAFNEDPPTGGFGANAMVVSKSTDRGATWGSPIVLQADPEGPVLNDKNSITADATDSSYVYAVWDRLEEFLTARGNGRTNILQRLGAPDGTQLARSRLRAAREDWRKATPPVNQPFLQFQGPAVLARTTDGGENWGSPVVVYNPGRGNQTIGNQVVVLPNGNVIQFFTEILNTVPSGLVNLAYLISTNKGAHFGAVQRVGPIDSEGTVTPDLKQPVRDGSILFDVAVDPGNGDLYAVWQDRRFANVEQVALSTSVDGGGSWSSPIRVSMTPPNSKKLREQAFLPSVVVASNHVVAITYYDFRNDDKSGELTDYWAVFCASNCSSSGSWTNEVRLTQAPFNILEAPFAGGYFLGDYMGLAASGNEIHPVFGIATGANITELFTTKIDEGSLGP